MVAEAPQKTSNCPAATAWEAFHHGTLPATDAETLSAHLEQGCTDCEACLQRIEDGPDALTALIRQSGLTPPVPERVGPYRIVRELGRGGMGVVYLAVDPNGRQVAVKCINQNAVGLEERFRKEVAASAQVEHSNVVRMYTSDIVDGVPYLVSEYVKGQSLDQVLTGKPLTMDEAARIIAAAARGIAFAHAKGVLHRDIKPGNILIGEGDTVKVTDFGLARLVEEAQTRLTRSGSLLGTPEYMAPEQAFAANAESPGVDVYSLGATLYELLTGRPPFRGTKPLEILDQARSIEPVSVTRLQTKCPRDLDTICLKCLQKEPHRRYLRASDLADDLDRFRAGKPILARPLGPVKRFVRLVNRHRRAAAAIAFAFLLVSSLAAYSTYQWGVAQRATEKSLGDQYVLLISSADQHWQSGRPDQVFASLNRCPEALRNWEWHFLKRRSEHAANVLYRHEGGVAAVGVSADDGTVWSMGDDGYLRGMHLADRRVLGPYQVCPPGGVHAKFNRGCRFLAVVPGVTEVEEITLWDLTRHAATRIPVKLTNILCISFSPDGTHLACGGYDGIATVIELPSGRVVREYRGHLGRPLSDDRKKNFDISSIAFSPDGQWLATGVRCEWHLWHVNDVERPARMFDGYQRVTKDDLVSVNTLAFAGDDGAKVLAAGHLDQRQQENSEIILTDVNDIGIRDAKRSNVIGEFNHSYTPIAVADHGKFFACKSPLEAAIAIRSLPECRDLATIRTTKRIAALAFLHGARGLLSGHAGGRVAFWPLPCGSMVVPEIRSPDHSPRHFGLAATADGHRVLGTMDDACSVFVQDRRTNVILGILEGHEVTVQDIVLSPSERFAATASRDHTLRVWNLNTMACTALLTGQKFPTRALFLDETHVLSGGADPNVMVWDLATPQSPRVLLNLGQDRSFRSLARSTDRRRIAIADNKDRIHMLDEAGRVIAIWESECDGISAMAFTPDGRSLTVATLVPCRLLTIDVATGIVTNMATIPGHEMKFLAYASDGQRLFVASYAGVVHVWLPDLEEILKIHAHRGACHRGVLLSNGELLTSGWDEAIRVWDGRR